MFKASPGVGQGPGTTVPGTAADWMSLASSLAALGLFQLQKMELEQILSSSLLPYFSLWLLIQNSFNS